MKQPLKIWLPSIRAGSGSDVFMLRLAEGLRRAGHEVVSQWFDRKYELMPWRLESVPAPPDTDLVHAGSWQGFAFKRVGVPLIVTEHQYISNPDFAPYRNIPQMLYHHLFVERWVRRSYAAADAIVAVSEYCATAMRSDLRKPVTVIHNWVDTASFSPRKNTPESVPRAQPFKLLFVGNPSRWKGADLLPVIAERLGQGFELNCLGGLRRGFHKIRVRDNMRLLEPRQPDRMPELYRAMDAVLIPTRYESFGYVALEAMACGLPVVGFDSSGTAEVCQHGKTALLAPVEDVERLAGYIRQLAAAPSLCAELGAAGRHRAVEHFNEADAVSAYLDVYTTILSDAVYPR
ncbi:MAG: glycosyltransferase family 4 protein [Gammaproteobacteria bacterium]